MILLRDKKIKMGSPKDVAKVCQDLLGLEDKIDQDKEHFYVFHLDSRNTIKLVELVSIGTLNSSLVHPREVFTRAVGERTASIIIAHNHPSGEQEPSVDDIAVTQKIAEAGRILDIELLDHIIFSKESHTSLKERELI